MSNMTESTVPAVFNIWNFANLRAQEIAALNEAIGNPQRPTLARQRLPRHMQRRTMSHNPNRLPKALRKFSSKPTTKSLSRPRRKYRRRPQNLSNEYVRRQRDFVWLETHIWHAKRFHMINKWGYRLPNYPNDKAFRACYRATRKHCLLQDISYYQCVEINGNYKNITRVLRQLTSPKCGLTFDSKYLSKGDREGNVTIFHKNCYPYNVIGPVKFMWKVSTSEQSTLWIWVHPVHYEIFLKVLIDVFQLMKMADENVEKVTDENKMEVDVSANSDENLNESKIDKSRVVKYQSNLHKDVRVIELKYSLCRLRLTGPLSQSIITDAFLPLQSSEILTTSDKKDWIKEHYNSYTEDNIKFLLNEKINIWTNMKNITDPAQLPANLVLPLIVKDPRFIMPEKRTKIVHDTNDVDNQLLIELPHKNELLMDNPLWEESIRNKVMDNKLSTNEINKYRANQLVPGGNVIAEYNNKHYLPVTVVLSNFYQNNVNGITEGVGRSSWDIILPAGWVMPVWLGLVWRGARVGGLRETESIYHECGIMSPIAPDSEAGQNNNENEAIELTNEYFKYPPAKRRNFIKLGSVSPFRYPWKELLRDWNQVNSETKLPSTFFVLRDRAALININATLKQLSVMQKSGFDNCDCFGIDLSEHDKSRTLVGIGLVIDGNGNTGEHSTVCLPTVKDLAGYHSRPKVRPIEASHRDYNNLERNKCLKERVALSNKMKKLKASHVDKNDEKYKVLKRAKLDLTEKINTLWLPDFTNGYIKESADRHVMGMVVKGGFSFSQSCPSALAYIPLTALCNLVHFYVDYFKFHPNIKNRKPIVLIRPKDNFTYCFATLNVLLDYNSQF